MFKKKKKPPAKEASARSTAAQAAVMNTMSGSKETMVARAGDIPAAQKLGILNMLRDEKNN